MRRYILSLFLAALVVLPTAACRNDASFLPRAPSNSAEEIARRVGPSVKDSADYKAEPNYLCYFKNLIPSKSDQSILEYPVVPGAPTYRMRQPARGGWITATFQVLPTAGEAEQRADKAKQLARGCVGHSDSSPYGGNELEAKLSNAAYQRNGWRGVRTTSLGEHGSDETKPFGLVSVFAFRGPVFASLTWIGSPSLGRHSIAELLATGDHAIEPALRKVGGDPREAAPQHRDPGTPSAKASAALITPTEYGYHDDGRLYENPPSGSAFSSYTERVEPPNGVAVVQRSLLSSSVRVEELVTTLPTEQAAQHYYERLPIPGASGGCSLPGADNREDGGVEDRFGIPRVRGLHRDGWSGLIYFCAARLSGAPANAPATDQLAEVAVVARSGTRVVYIYFGGTASPDLQSTVDSHRAVVERELDALG